MWVLTIFAVVSLVASEPPQARDCQDLDAAMTYAEAGQFAEALAVLGKVRSDDHCTMEAHVLSAVCHARLGHRERAAKSVTAFLDGDPGRDQLSAAGQVFRQLGLTLPDQVGIDLPAGARLPILLSFSNPSMPDRARAAGWATSITACGTIGVDGRMSSVRTSLGQVVVLDDYGTQEAVARAVRRWRFFPALLDGEPVAVEMCAVADFTAED